MITEKDIPEINIRLSSMFPYTIVYRYKPGISKEEMGDYIAKDIKTFLELWKSAASCKYIFEEFAAFHIMPDGEIRKVTCEVRNG